ncbi:uncharacterized protein MELLADRAFT_114335 [Melampsora larici-populina 98AG31]|uniref:Uncharacterized protein n=1 Tax=Melampsora larici-populina (strain 98AG31 / pathotype 3-4-7) TaxID=747676 RepID=F4SD29_MELLP|nr:uncharacterized protein MELLADRAFT_114335 [Melampsora larici-populina 98AG31]EGF97451.1 hypothetical protein MELLADRAFT_114335 [Melampsora larici-populina 98AG31]
MSYKMESFTLDDQLMAGQFATTHRKSVSESKLLEAPETPMFRVESSINVNSTFTPRTPTNRPNSYTFAQLFTPTQRPKSERELYANFFTRLESHQVQLLRDRRRWTSLTPQSQAKKDPRSESVLHTEWNP